MPSSGPDSQLYAILTSAAQRVLVPTGNAYEVGLDVMGTIGGELITTAACGGRAYCLWAELTDIADAPRIDDPALCEERSRMAAAEWLEVDTNSSDAIERYFERWQGPLEPRDVPDPAS